MLVSYPALFYYDPHEAVKYSVHFSDLKSHGTQSETISLIEDLLFKGDVDIE